MATRSGAMARRICAILGQETDGRLRPDFGHGDHFPRFFRGRPTVTCATLRRAVLALELTRRRIHSMQRYVLVLSLATVTLTLTASQALAATAEQVCQKGRYYAAAKYASCEQK